MLTPQDLALAYDRHVAAFCREDVDAAMAFATWLAAFSVDGGPPEPVAYPDAISFLGGAGRGVRWYSVDTNIVGYLPDGPRGCYRVPASAVPPAVRSSASPRGISIGSSRQSVAKSPDGDAA